MTKQKIFDINSAFENYKETIFTIDNDLRFWQSFLTGAIKNYQAQTVIPDEIYSAIFAAYDIDSASGNGYLKTHKESISLKTVDLEGHKNLFFKWIMHLSILKSYNAMETFLLQAIWLQYYPNLKNPTGSKKDYDKLQIEIKAYLTSEQLLTDSKNNRHIIEFLKTKSAEFLSFSQMTIRIDLTTTWVNYFELLSILRNIIAHQGTLVSLDTQNEIKSRAKDIFERHFIIATDGKGDKHLQPIEKDFNDFISIINDFAVNTTKFISNQTDLRFLKLT